MKRKHEVTLEAFFRLWRSSESLRLLIRNAIKNEQFIEFAEGRIDLKLSAGHLNRGNTAGSARPNRSLIENGGISSNAVSDFTAQTYGGLNRKTLLVLLEKFKGGKRNLGTYLLIRQWKRVCAKSAETPDIRLEQFTLDYFRRAIIENRDDFFQEIADAVRFLKGQEYQENDNWNHDPANWWQFHLLLYVLEHPKGKYAMREFVKHFREEVGENEMPTTKTIRSFCRANGIALDSRPGAPKKLKT